MTQARSLLQTLGSRCFIAVLRLSAMLPYTLSRRLGHMIGKLYIIILPKRKRVITTNIKRCFPTLPPQKINQLIHENILAHGAGLIEAGMAWWHSDHTLNAFTRYTGFQHYQEAQNQGRGVILLSGHFTTLELGARLLAMKIPNIHLN